MARRLVNVLVPVLLVATIGVEPASIAGPGQPDHGATFSFTLPEQT